MTMMKMLKTFLFVGAILISSTFFSCSDDGYSLDKYSIGVATVKPLGDNAYYLQWDDSTTFWPAAGVMPHFGLDRERRALINFTLLGDSANGGFKGYDYTVRVNCIDSILTKQIAPNLGEKNDSYYGNDPVWMKSVWIEDGYINFQFETYFDGMTKHFINLVETDTPYCLEFRHNAYGNLIGGQGWGLTSFHLNSLPATDDEMVTLTIRYRSHDGDKSIQLRYRPGTSTGEAPMMGDYNFQPTN